jgi:hypothetical protein
MLDLWWLDAIPMMAQDQRLSRGKTIGVLLTSTATKDSRTDHWPDSEGSVGPTWIERVNGKGGGGWNGVDRRTVTRVTQRRRPKVMTIQPPLKRIVKEIFFLRSSLALNII